MDTTPLPDALETVPALDAALTEWEHHGRPGLPDRGFALSRLPGRERRGIYRVRDARSGGDADPVADPVFEPEGHILRMAPSPDGRRIAVQLAERADEDAALVLVDTATGEARTYPEVRCRYDPVLWSADSSRVELVAGGSRRFVELDADTGDVRTSAAPPDVRLRLFPGGGRGLLAESRPGSATVLTDRATGAVLGEFPAVVRVLAAAGGALVDTGRRIAVLDARDGTERWSWEDPSLRVTSVAARGGGALREVLVAGVRAGRSVLVRLCEGEASDDRPVAYRGEPAVATEVGADGGRFDVLIEGPVLPPRVVRADELLRDTPRGGDRTDRTEARAAEQGAGRVPSIDDGTDISVEGPAVAARAVAPRAVAAEEPSGRERGAGHPADRAALTAQGTPPDAPTIARTERHASADAADDGTHGLTEDPAAPPHTRTAGEQPREDRSAEQRTYRASHQTTEPTRTTKRDSAPAPSPLATTERHAFPADDGTDVPVVVTSPVDATGPAPLILTCYGGFGVPSLATFEPTVPTWIGHGGRYAIAQIRGGGEHGAAWREAGRGAAKARGIDDLAAVARGLVGAGLTRPDLLVLVGASHGGVVAASCAFGSPGLCAGVVSTAAPLDLLNLGAHPLGRHWTGEFGGPDGAAEPGPDLDRRNERLRRISPLHRARSLSAGTTGLPRFLGIVLDEDSRVAADDTLAVVDALRRVGGDAALWRAPRTGHGGNHLDSLHLLGATVLSFAATTTRSARSARPPRTTIPEAGKGL
ncbi:prolyl oligopeptidase family serine peptidase [Nocardiopsis chromatogenes]|uniref:prolyl oligopeptidase family serine peptidase n=1 Tax=Nocardiopsis chromatogenes TaxID=280239 RepID=UPI000380B730|nr:prolyl oligopeptidase family serine peptidase [Nocardiopsis chromatogenes]